MVQFHVGYAGTIVAEVGQVGAVFKTLAAMPSALLELTSPAAKSVMPTTGRFDQV